MGSDSAKSPLAVKESIDSARILTDLTGGVHEIQAVNLKRWPLLAIDGAESCEVHVDVGSPTPREDIDQYGNAPRPNRMVYVRFEVVSQKDPTEEQVMKWKLGTTLLTSYVRDLFWSNTEVEVFVNNRKVET